MTSADQTPAPTPAPTPARSEPAGYLKDAPDSSRNAVESFNALRSRLFAVAYRMLGTRADAEDVVQDAWLRWQGTDATTVRSADAWLVTTVTRLAIDRLRSVKVE